MRAALNDDSLSLTFQSDDDILSSCVQELDQSTGGGETKSRRVFLQGAESGGIPSSVLRSVSVYAAVSEGTTPRLVVVTAELDFVARLLRRWEGVWLDCFGDTRGR